MTQTLWFYVFGFSALGYLLIQEWPRVRKVYRAWFWRSVTRANLKQLRRQR